MSRQLDQSLEALLSEERFAFYQAVCEFSHDEVEPNMLRWEREHTLLPDEFIAKMGEMGLFGLTVKEQYGGQGGTLLDLVLLGLALMFLGILGKKPAPPKVPPAVVAGHKVVVKRKSDPVLFFTGLLMLLAGAVLSAFVFHK